MSNLPFKLYSCCSERQTASKSRNRRGVTQNTHLNLLNMTATMSRTKTVIMAMVMMRFVAMLQEKYGQYLLVDKSKGYPSMPPDQPRA
jgi:hypothetical protein